MISSTSELPVIGLFGGGPVALKCLQLLQILEREGKCTLLGCNASHPRERENALVLDFASAHGIQCFDSPDDLASFENLSLSFSIGNGWIFPEHFIERMTGEIINFHAGPLPQYKGSAVPAFAILNEEQHFGVTFHKVVPELDAGPIIHREDFPISPDMTSKEVDRLCIETGIRCLDEMLETFIIGEYCEYPQTEGPPAYSRKDVEPYRKLGYDWDTQKFWNHVRACDWEGVLKPAYIDVNGRKVYLTARMRGTYIT
jgi:methionyl-tRNA formyltransferase